MIRYDPMYAKMSFEIGNFNIFHLKKLLRFGHRLGPDCIGKQLNSEMALIRNMYFFTPNIHSALLHHIRDH
jgi:hypothetical protein